MYSLQTPDQIFEANDTQHSMKAYLWTLTSNIGKPSKHNLSPLRSIKTHDQTQDHKIQPT